MEMNVSIINGSQKSEVRNLTPTILPLYQRGRREGVLYSGFCILASIFCLLSIFFGLPSAVYGTEEKRVVNEEMGIMVATITEEYKQDLSLDNANGVIVLGVLPGGPADQGGIHPGDIILGIADIAINNLDEYEDAIKKLKGRMDFNIMIRTRDGSFSFIQIISHEE